VKSFYNSDIVSTIASISGRLAGSTTSVAFQESAQLRTGVQDNGNGVIMEVIRHVAEKNEKEKILVNSRRREAKHGSSEIV
jgi:hypothetical protein